MRKGGFLFWLGGALIFLGAALLGVYWYDLHRATQAQQRAKQWLNATAVTRRTPPVWSTPPTVRPGIHRGDVLGELNIPRLHLSVVVFEGDDAGILKIGAGHIPGTALPSGNGNIGIAAHRDTYFRPLRVIHPDDVITLRTPAGAARFTVTRTEIVRPTDVKVLAPAPGRDLTLVTCYPFSYVGHAPQRFIVHARKIG
jgi:LPXTG-site transpeptidase (sortase) family protein